MKISNTSKRLKEIMNIYNLKQVDILEKAKQYCDLYETKLTKVDLSQYLSGKVEPGQAKLFVLARALNTNEAWLMGFDVPMNAKSQNTSIIMDFYNQLNDLGKKEAEKRVEELTYLPKYVATNLTISAASERAGIEITKEDKAHDEALMRKKNF